MSLDKMLKNTKSVKKFVEDIHSHLELSTNAWMSIANEFASAKGMLTDKEFKQLRTEIRFSYSTVCKLIKIANSTRIKKNQDKLALIDAWSTLHEIVKLDTKKFTDFEKEYLSGDAPRYFKRSDVLKIKNGTCATKKSEFNVIAVLKVNLKQIDNVEMRSLQEKVETFLRDFAKEESVKYELNDLSAKLDEMNQEIQEKDAAALERLAEKNVRKRMRELFKHEKSKLPRKNRLKVFHKKFGLTEEELMSGTVEEMNTVISEFDSFVQPLTPEEMYA